MKIRYTLAFVLSSAFTAMYGLGASRGVMYIATILLIWLAWIASHRKTAQAKAHPHE